MKSGSSRWEWRWDAELAFRKVKRAFTEAPILHHFDPRKRITIPTDPSSLAIDGVLNLHDGFGSLRPVNFSMWKCSPAKQNYDTYNRKLLAIVESMKQWRHYLKGTDHKVFIQCDHKNLEYFQTSKVLSGR
jgi:hypothetical protein